FAALGVRPCLDRGLDRAAGTTGGCHKVCADNRGLIGKEIALPGAASGYGTSVHSVAADERTACPRISERVTAFDRGSHSDDVLEEASGSGCGRRVDVARTTQANQ